MAQKYHKLTRPDLFKGRDHREMGPWHLVALASWEESLQSGFDKVLGTFIRPNGSPIYAKGESQLALYHKIPDYKFIGQGVWEVMNEK